MSAFFLCHAYIIFPVVCQHCFPGFYESSYKMSNRKNRAEKLSFTKVQGENSPKQGLSKQEKEIPNCKTKNKSSKVNGKKKLTLSDCLRLPKYEKSKKKRENNSKKRKNRPEFINSSDVFKSSPSSGKIPSPSAVSNISLSCTSKSQFLKENEKPLSPTKNTDCVNDKQPYLNSESSLSPHHIQNVPYNSSLISVNSDTLNVKDKDKFVDTFPEIQTTSGADFDDLLSDDSLKLGTTSSILVSNCKNDNEGIAIKDTLHDIADSNDYANLKNRFVLLMNELHANVNSNENLIRDILKIQPFIRPPDFNYEQKSAFDIAVDISRLKAANDYIKENASKFAATFSSTNSEKTCDLSMNCIDSNSEDRESEVSFSSCTTGDINLSFLEKIIYTDRNSAEYSVELDTSATKVSHTGSEIVQESKDNDIDVSDKSLTKACKGKKRKKKKSCYPRKRRCQRKNGTSVPKSDNAPNENFYDSWDDSELEEETMISSSPMNTKESSEEIYISKNIIEKKIASPKEKNKKGGDAKCITNGVSQENIVPKNTIEVSCQNDVIVENTNDELDEQQTLETGSHLLHNGEIDINSIKNKDSEVFNHKPKKKKLENNAYIKCSLDLNMFKDNFKEAIISSDNKMYGCSTEVVSIDKFNLKKNPVISLERLPESLLTYKVPLTNLDNTTQLQNSSLPTSQFQPFSIDLNKLDKAISKGVPLVTKSNKIVKGFENKNEISPESTNSKTKPVIEKQSALSTENIPNKNMKHSPILSKNLNYFEAPNKKSQSQKIKHATTKQNLAVEAVNVHKKKKIPEKSSKAKVTSKLSKVSKHQTNSDESKNTNQDEKLNSSSLKDISMSNSDKESTKISTSKSSSGSHFTQNFGTGIFQSKNVMSEVSDKKKQTTNHSNDLVELYLEEDLDFEYDQDQVDDLKNEHSTCNKSLNSTMPIKDIKDNLGLSSEKQLDTDLDKTIESNLNASSHILESSESSQIFPLEILNIHNIKSHSQRSVLSEDDSDSDKEHSFKRSRYEEKNNEEPSFWEVKKSSEEIPKQQSKENKSLPNTESYLKNSNDAGQKLVSNTDSCIPASVSGTSSKLQLNREKAIDEGSNSNVLLCRLKDVGCQIQEHCQARKYNKAVEIAQTYIKISSSLDAHLDIIKKLLLNIFIYSSSNDIIHFKVLDDVLKLIQEFNIYNKFCSSCFIVRCCGHSDLCIYSIKMYDICHKHKIPLSQKAIDSYTTLLKAEKVSLLVLLDYINFIKSVCKKEVSKDLIHLTLEQSKACKSYIILHEICSVLNCISPEEVDERDLADFLQFCFKKEMWLYVADMFMKWNTKHCLIICICDALIKSREAMGKYFSKFADAVYGQETKLQPELESIFGYIGNCLMLEAFAKNNLQIALNILYVLHMYNVNIFDAYECDSDDVKKTSQFYIIFASLDICLNSKTSKEAFTIFQEFSWLRPTEDLSEVVRAYVLKEKYQRLLKLVCLLSHGDFLSEGWVALKELVNGIEQDLFQETSKERIKKLCSVYNKYLARFLTSGNITLLGHAFDLYQHCIGPKKDIFVFNPSVLRGFIVAFYKHGDLAEAYSLFTDGIEKKVYFIKKPESETFPWQITIWSTWTKIEIKLAIEWFIGMLFSLLMGKPRDTGFEKWFSFKVIIFKVIVVLKNKGSSSVTCLLEAETNSEDCMMKTKEVLQDLTLQYTEETDALCVKSDSLYAYWQNRNKCPEASVKFPPIKIFSLFKRKLFGNETIVKVDTLPIPEKNNESHSHSRQFETLQTAEVSEFINECRANSSKQSYSPVTSNRSPSSKSPIKFDSSDSCARGKISSNNAEISNNFAPKTPAFIQTNVPKRLSNASVHAKQRKLSNNDQTSRFKIQISGFKAATSPRNNKNISSHVQVKSKGKNASKQIINTFRKSLPQKKFVTFEKPETETPNSSNPVQNMLSNKQSPKRDSPKKIISLKKPCPKSNSVMGTKKNSETEKKLPKLGKKFENFTVSIKSNTSVRMVSSSPQSASVVHLNSSKNVEMNKKNSNADEQNAASKQVSVEGPFPHTKIKITSEPSICDVGNQKQEFKAHVTNLQNVSTLPSTNTESTKSGPKALTKQLNKISHVTNALQNVLPQSVKKVHPTLSKPILKRNSVSGKKIQPISSKPFIKKICDVQESKTVTDITKMGTVENHPISNSEANVPAVFRNIGQKNDLQKLRMEEGSGSASSEKAGTSSPKKSRTNFSGLSRTSISDRSRSCSIEDFKKIYDFLLRKLKLKCDNVSEGELETKAKELADAFIHQKNITSLDKKGYKELHEFSLCIS